VRGGNPERSESFRRGGVPNARSRVNLATDGRVNETCSLRGRHTKCVARAFGGSFGAEFLAPRLFLRALRIDTEGYYLGIVRGAKQMPVGYSAATRFSCDIVRYGAF
jgi:hypothetical protein